MTAESLAFQIVDQLSDDEMTLSVEYVHEDGAWDIRAHDPARTHADDHRVIIIRPTDGWRELVDKIGGAMAEMTGGKP